MLRWLDLPSPRAGLQRLTPSYLCPFGVVCSRPDVGVADGGLNASPFSYSSEYTRLVVPGRPGISFGCAIYVISVGTVPVTRNGDADPTINQLPGDRASSVIMGEPLYAFDLHLAGKHHPGSTEIVPQTKIGRLQVFTPGSKGPSLLSDLSDLSDTAIGVKLHRCRTRFVSPCGPGRETSRRP